MSVVRADPPPEGKKWIQNGKMFDRGKASTWDFFEIVSWRSFRDFVGADLMGCAGVGVISQCATTTKRTFCFFWLRDAQVVL